MSLKIGMAQILVEGGQPESNLARAAARIQEAAHLGCKVVVLPECMDLGWTHPSARELAQPIPGARFQTLSDTASANEIYVVAGLVERDGERLFNSAVLISPGGELLCLHRKINVLNIAHDLYSIGDRLTVADTEFGTVAINICADNFGSSQAISHVQARMGARLVLSPSAWAVDAEHDNESDPYGQLWRDSYTELARLYDLTIVGVSNVGRLDAGPWSGRKAIGCSLAVGPDGEILAQGPYGDSAEALIVVDVEIKQPPAQGTNIAPMLKSRGYTGP
ncbi:MAG: carbon-nitrogen hydrolase family protein [Planctomycetota bacterium]|nr:carbon-nitrogen hydrolase family protein [Planctomycetota bacterium]MDA1137245.1 carbon-nitrogen hydrolase family protein [Planctomycetota bacterium]